MKVNIYSSESKGREIAIAQAFARGVACHGDSCMVTHKDNGREADVAIVIGVKGRSKQLIETYRGTGRQAIFIDKSYLRESARSYLKTSVGGFQPLPYLLNMQVDGSRWDEIAKKYTLSFPGWREPVPRGHVAYFGPSQKYCNFHGLGDATAYSASVIEEIKRHSNRTVVYRPKASWSDAVPIDGSVYSQLPRGISDELQGAHAAVVHGSNAGAEAIIHGVPVICLGPAIARPISSTSIGEIENPIMVSHKRVMQWLHAISWAQWELPEITSGQGWDHLKGIMQNWDALTANA